MYIMLDPELLLTEENLSKEEVTTESYMWIIIVTSTFRNPVCINFISKLFQSELA